MRLASMMGLMVKKCTTRMPHSVRISRPTDTLNLYLILLKPSVLDALRPFGDPDISLHPYLAQLIEFLNKT